MSLIESTSEHITKALDDENKGVREIAQRIYIEIHKGKIDDHTITISKNTGEYQFPSG